MNSGKKLFYTLKNAPSMKNFKQEFEALSKDEQKNLKNEVYKECGLNADLKKLEDEFDLQEIQEYKELKKSGKLKIYPIAKLWDAL